MKKNEIKSSAAEYLTFITATGESGVEAIYADENVWLSQKMMGLLYDVETNTINYHLKKLFDDREIDENSVIRNFRITAQDGKKYNTKHYNLKAIIAVEQDVYFPCQYHLETLAHTEWWRNDESIEKIVKAINYHDKIMNDNNSMAIKIGSKYYGPLWAYVTPFKAFETNKVGDVAQRKTLTHLARVGGKEIDVVRKSAEVVKEALAEDGILRLDFESSYQKRRFKESLKYPGPYTEVALEPSYKKDTAIWCDLTFWAVQLLHIIEEKS